MLNPLLRQEMGINGRVKIYNITGLPEVRELCKVNIVGVKSFYSKIIFYLILSMQKMENSIY